MNSYSFPPADDLIAYLKKVDYQKIWNTILTAILFTGALIYVLYTRLSVWYQNGGKESIVQTYVKIRKLSLLLFAWLRDRAFPAVKNALESVSETYRAWQNLVTV